MNLIVFQPERRWYLPDWIGAREADRGFNWAFYDSIKRGAVDGAKSYEFEIDTVDATFSNLWGHVSRSGCVSRSYS